MLGLSIYDIKISNRNLKAAREMHLKVKLKLDISNGGHLTGSDLSDSSIRTCAESEKVSNYEKDNSNMVVRLELLSSNLPKYLTKVAAGVMSLRLNHRLHVIWRVH